MYYLQKELYDLIKTEDGIFDFLQKAALDGLWYWDLDNPAEEWMNAQFWETLGYDPIQQLHSPVAWQDIIFPEDGDRAIEAIERHLRDPNEDFDEVVRYRHKDGHTVWIRCRGMAIRGRDNRPRRLLGAHIEITALKRQEEELEHLKAEYETVFHGTQDAMFLIDVNGLGDYRYIRNNRSHQELTGLTTEELRGLSPSELLGEEAGKEVVGNYNRCVERRDVISYEEELIFGDRRTWWSTVLTPILDNGEVSFIVGSAIEITERKSLEEKLMHLALVDELTMLPNRRAGLDMLQRKIDESQRYESSFALMFIDLDGFKAINDHYGHDSGDCALRLTAERLTRSIRRSDFVARMGGDEFLVILGHVDGEAEVTDIGKKIRQNVSQAMTCVGKDATLDASIGVAFYRGESQGVDELLRQADQAMYAVKKSGKAGLQIANS